MTTNVFASIARGELEAPIVHRTDASIAILDIAPTTPLHTLVFPVREHQVLGQLDDAERSDLFATLRLIRHATMRADDTITGLTSVIHQGPAAGQRAPHLLVHTIPRRDGDSLFSHSNTSGPTLELDGIARLIDDAHITLDHPDDSRVPSEVRIFDTTSDLFEMLEPDRIERFASVIDTISTALFEQLEAEGTSILIESGSSQSVVGAEARIIPRWKSDGLDLSWQPGEATDLRASQDALITQIESLTSKPIREPDDHREVQEPENYLVKQLRRIP